MPEENVDIRWKQRFENFEKSFLSMNELLEKVTLTKTEKTALIKYFEMTFELSWKVLKDYLEDLGFDPKSPRETIKKALQMELVLDGYGWLDALEKRNLMSHTYDEATSNLVVEIIITKFSPLLCTLYDQFKQKI